jgi:hypothetical protein
MFRVALDLNSMEALLIKSSRHDKSPKRGGTITLV